MPLRALRLLPFPTPSEATFATTLQIAAGRAWSRRVIAHGPVKTAGRRGFRMQAQTLVASNEWQRPSQPGPSRFTHAYTGLAPPSSESKKPPHRLRRPKSKPSLPAESKPPLVNVTYFNPGLCDYEPVEADFSRAEPDPDDHFDCIPSNTLPQVVHLASVDPLRPITASPPPTPKSRTSLYRNLLYLVNIRKPVLMIPALLDYHVLYSELQSTSSYNLLIDLSLRHRSLGIVRQLFASLQMNNIPKNIETYKLEVRWLISQGLWDAAWRYVQGLKNDRKLPRDKSGRLEIPYPIWLEFCRFPKRRNKLRSVRDEDGQLVERYFETLIDQPEDLLFRQRLLNQNRPHSMPTLSNTTPFAAYCLVQLLIRTGNQDRALALTKAYFKEIPRTLNAKSVLRCLNIIHVHMVTTPAKDGLPKFYESRRTMFSLLKLHPQLRPNARTLYLLLDPLRRAKHCGSLAWKVLHTFKSQWGSLVEDRRVQRRVIQLALKEGRLDIVQKMTQCEKSDCRYRRRRLLEEHMVDGLKIVPARWHIRFPLRSLYPKNGREARLWYRLRARIRLKVYQRRRAQRRIRKNVKDSGSILALPSMTKCFNIY